MRFHIGISKRVKIKTIITFLGALFLLILATLGLDRVNAETTWTNITISSGFFHSPYAEALTYSSDFNDIFTPTATLQYTTNYGKGVRFYNTTLDKLFYMPFAMSKGFATTNSRYWNSNHLFNLASLKFNNSNYCENSSSDLKSINFQFPLMFDTNMQNDMAFFNQSSIADMFKVRIVAQSTSNNETILFPTYCTFESLEPNQNAEYQYRYLVTCNNVFQGNSNYSVSDFTIQIINSIPFNDRYSDSTQNKGIVALISIGNSDYDMSNLVNYQLRYSCSVDPPVLDNGSGGEDDPNGLNDIYDKIRGELEDENWPSGMMNYLEMPDSISDLASLPLVFLQKVFENGDYQCVNYELDFSSLAEWLNGSYNSNDYKVKLPCMRSILSTHFGALYNLADILMACLVFYSIAKHIFNFVDLLTEGEDLFSYYFTSGDDDSSIGGHKANAYVNHKTGEVKFK